MHCMLYRKSIELRDRWQQVPYTQNAQRRAPLAMLQQTGQTEHQN